MFSPGHPPAPRGGRCPEGFRVPHLSGLRRTRPKVLVTAKATLARPVGSSVRQCQRTCHPSGVQGAPVRHRNPGRETGLQDAPGLLAAPVETVQPPFTGLPITDARCHCGHDINNMLFHRPAFRRLTPAHACSLALPFSRAYCPSAPSLSQAGAHEENANQCDAAGRTARRPR